MKILKPAINFSMGAMCTLLVISQFSFRESKNEKPFHAWVAPAIPDKLSFANEPAPVARWDIREKFDKEFLLNYYNQGTILYLIKLANRNFPILESRLKANGVPEDFKYLCIAESNMQGWAVSKSGAVGYWQFLDGTATGYGLESNNQVDQRQDLERSTDAACKYLKQAYQKFGNWTAAAASYNCGMGGYQSQVAFQQTTNYYDLHLPEETNKYIFRILSFKYLIEHAEELGFVVEDKEKYAPVETREFIVNSGISDLAEFAKGQGTNYKVMRALNPWIKGRSLSVKNGKAYIIRLPVKQ